MGAPKGVARLRAGSLVVSFLLGVSALAPSATAQDPATEPTQDTNPDERVRIRRTDVPPVIDGLLDDEVWRDAPEIPNLTMTIPSEGIPPTERTVTKLLHDADNIFIGVYCYDSEPDKIVATQMERDRDLDPDDRIEIVLDTFFDRRNAYFFQLSPAGSMGDALITGNGQFFDKDYDAIWLGRSKIVEDGWTAEFAIPFKSLSFTPDGPRWGFNINRVIKRKEERNRWATPRQNSSLFAIADAGTIEGLAGMEQGVGLDVIPFFAGTYFRDREESRRFLEGDPGLDAFYKVTNGLTAALTINTDFADTEVDSVQINLTRFPLFFPEKRDFFLQDKGIFEFGGIRRSPLPFFSRRIGLAAGEEIPIIAGLRLTGRTGPYSIGLLDVQTDSKGDIEEKNLAVARVTRNILEQSQVGVIATRGNPTDSGLNTLVGGDFTYRTSSLFGDKNLRFDAYAMSTSTSGRGGDGQAYSAALRVPNDRFDGRVQWTHIGNEFNPALGFVSRRGINRWVLDARVRPRFEGLVRRLNFGVNPQLTTSTGNDLLTREYEVTPFGIEFETGDRIDFEIEPTREVLEEPFEIQEDIILPVGTYDFTRYLAFFRTGDKRPANLRGRVETGTFFSGKRFDWFLALDIRPSKYVSLSFENEENRVRLDEGSFTTRILRSRFDFTFTPEISWNNFIQFDNQSDRLGINSRFRWIVTPGREVKVVLNQSWDRDGRDLAPVSTELTLKFEYLIRF